MEVAKIITKILVPIDGSDQSEYALDYAVNLALQTKAQIELLTVVPSVFLPTYSFYILKSDAIRDCQKQLEASFEGVLKKSLSYIEKKNLALKVSTKLAKGIPYKEIVKEAKLVDFDIIIMGSRGAEGQFSYEGSVSDRVIHEAPCPVLVVKEKYVRSAIRNKK